MSLLDTASLIVTPNGYKEGKLYSVIPSDGSGDLSVTRATTATRVNSAGLVELVPYNLFSYSQDLTTSAYTSGGTGSVVVTANYGTAPDGTTTADRVQITRGATYQELFQRIPGYSGQQVTMSFYAKSLSGTPTLITAFNDGYYNEVTFTTEWVRYEYTFTAGTNVTGSGFNLLTYASFPSTSASADLLVWGVQLVQGSTAKDYQKTETRLNIPRLDYSNGTCPSLLVEPQRTNLLTYSSSFDNGAWTPQTISVSANATTSPDGTTTAETLTPSGSGAYDNRVYQTNSVTSGAVYTLSVWAKSSASNAKLTLGLQNHGGQVFSITNEWERYSVAVTALSTGGNFNIYAGDVTPTTGVVNSSNVVTIWGAQLELGSYASSYIPTTSASVTRNADVISKTGISSLIGQTEGTLFVDLGLIKSGPLGADFGSIDDGTSQNRIHFFLNTSNKYGIYSEKLGATQWYFVSSVSPTGNDKLAIAYANNDVVLYINGTQVGSSNTFSVPATSAFRLNDRYDNAVKADVMQIKAEALWKTRLTNTQLAQLTSI